MFFIAKKLKSRKFMDWLKKKNPHSFMSLEGRNFSITANLIIKGDGKVSLLHLGMPFHSLVEW